MASLLSSFWASYCSHGRFVTPGGGGSEGLDRGRITVREEDSGGLIDTAWLVQTPVPEKMLMYAHPALAV